MGSTQSRAASTGSRPKTSGVPGAQADSSGFSTAPSSPRLIAATPHTFVQPASRSIVHAKPHAREVKYHPLSGMPKPGYQGALSADQLAAVDDLRDRMHSRGLVHALDAAAATPAEDQTDVLLRFLRARAFDVEKAAALLEADLRWRQQEQIASLADMSAAEVLGCDPSLIEHYLPSWRGGVDKQCRPVLWSKYGDLRVDELLKHTSMERLVRYHVWESEQMLKRMRALAGAEGVRLSQVVNVVDAAHWHPGLATRTAMGFLKMLAGIDQDHYPERMGVIITINAPYTLSACWAIISTWLDPATRAKVQIISAERYWRPALKQLIADDHIPVEYGGTNTDARMRDLSVLSEPPPLIRAVTV